MEVTDAGRGFKWVKVEITDKLHREAKAAAALRGESLSDFVIHAMIRRSMETLSEYGGSSSLG